MFDCSIRKNISYGASFKYVPFDAVAEAARKANAHDFIMGLPQVSHVGHGQVTVA